MVYADRRRRTAGPVARGGMHLETKRLPRGFWRVTGLVIALATGMAWAQGAGSLVVRVADEAGLPVAGATVTLSHETGSIKATAVLTDEEGRAAFPVLRPGSGYVVEVSLAGFASQRHTDLRVPISDRLELEVRLSGEIEERVRVVASRPVVDLEQTASSRKFSDEFIQDLPVPGRFYQNVLTLSPGVQDHNEDKNPTVHGSRSRDFKAVVSGISNVDPLTGQYMSLINADSIEEMEVITSGASVEFGRAQGGFARIVQKQGTNRFEGAIGVLWRSSELDRDGAGSNSNLPPVQFSSTQPSAMLSGPIVHDRLWFRLAYDLTDGETPVNVVNSIETTALRQEVQAHQLTWQASPRNKLAFQYQTDPLDWDRVGLSSKVRTGATRRFRRQSEQFTLTWTTPVSPKLLVESQVAWQDQHTQIDPSTGAAAANDCLLPGDTLSTALCVNLDTSTTSGPYHESLDANSQRFTVQSTATLYAGRLAGADHQLKLGFVAENERYRQRLTRGPRIDFETETRLVEGDIELMDVDIVAATLAIPPEREESLPGNNWAVFFEDQIRPLSNLSLTVGARLDRTEIDARGRSVLEPVPEQERFFDLWRECVLTFLEEFNQCPGFALVPRIGDVFTGFEAQDQYANEIAALLGERSTEVEAAFSGLVQEAKNWSKRRTVEPIELRHTNLSPYLSVAWDPFGDDKTKLAFSARRYYDKLYLAVPLLELNPASVLISFELDEGETTSLDTLSDSLNPVADVDSVDREIRIPYQDEYRLLFERELWAETLLRLEYLRRAYRDQLQDIDINHIAADFGFCGGNGAVAVTPLFASIWNPALWPGDGGVADGTLHDDCAGASDPNSGAAAPDGRPDLYVLNPAWGDFRIVGNFNESDYEAVVLELIRRQYRGWEMQGSYTWSMATGNGEDFLQPLGNDRTLLEDEFGFQSNDQRHVVKFAATTITPWGFRLGGAASWQSGLPFSELLRSFATDPSPPVYGTLGDGSPAHVRIHYPSGRRNDQRNDSYWNFDLKLTKELRLGRGVNVQLSAEIFNVLNDGTYQIYEPVSESGARVNGQDGAIRRFGRRFQLGFRVAF
jgi:hypothetical protein